MLYSEIFRSIQGEGHYTGVPTAWIRFFGCNLECSGFGQENPKDPSTYVLPYEKIDTTNITSVEELPVFKYGCDSSYSWSKKFAKIQKKGTPEEVAEKIKRHSEALGGISRFTFQIDNPGLKNNDLNDSYELIGKKVIPLVNRI